MIFFAARKVGRRSIRPTSFLRWMVVGLLPFAGGFAPAQSPPPARTAKVETTEIKTIGDSDKGMLRIGMDALLVQCNNIRIQAHLPVNYPPSRTFDHLDTVDHVYAYDGIRHRAVNLATTHLVRLDDLERWSKEHGAGSPPDCSVATAFTDKLGTLWRDGKRYELRFKDKKAMVLPNRAGDSVPQNLPSRPSTGAQDRMIAGQMCSMQSAPAVSQFIAIPEGCVWKGFDAVGYLNLPMTLSRTNRIGNEKGILGRETATSAVADVPLDESLFEIPADFKIIDRMAAR